MRKLTLAAVVVLGLASPAAAEAQTMSIVSGAVLGGLAGSVYISGLQATAATVGAATSSAISAIGAATPAAASAVAGAIAGASTPVLVGVVAGGVLGYMLLR